MQCTDVFKMALGVKTHIYSTLSSSFKGKLIMLHLAYHEIEELSCDDTDRKTDQAERKQILLLSIQNQTLHLLYFQSIALLCFKLLG